MKYLFLDVMDILNDRESKIPPLLYSTKGVNVRLSSKRLAALRAAMKAFPQMSIVISPSRYTKLTLLDYREMFKTFRVDPNRVVMVDVTMYGQEEEMAQIFRIQEFLLYHKRSIDNYMLLLTKDDVHLEGKQAFNLKHDPDLFYHTSIVSSGESIDVSSCVKNHPGSKTADYFTIQNLVLNKENN